MSPVVATNKLSVTTTLPKPGEYKALEPDPEDVVCCTKPLGYMPIGDRVIVLNAKEDEMTEGGLYKPQVAILNKNSGELVAAGLKAMDILHDAGIELGSDVYWGQYAGVTNEFVHKGRTYDVLTLRVEDILSSEQVYKLISSGKWAVRRGQTGEGETQHFFHRKA